MSGQQAVAKLLEDSLIGTKANDANKELRNIESNEGFSLVLLSIVESESYPYSVRLAASLFFKNFLNRNWIDSEGNHKLSAQDSQSIKSEIIKLMVGLNNNNLKKQIGECISIIANSDFPHNWENLIDELVMFLNDESINIGNINGILTVCHSIFKKWRPLFRSDALYLEIKFVLEKFVGKFMELFLKIDKLIDENSGNKEILEQLFENLLLLIKIYYDFNCHDIPEFFEDNMQPLMNINYKYLSYHNDMFVDKDEDEAVDILSKVKGSICDLIYLYSSRYSDVFDPITQKFVECVWTELNEHLTLQEKYDVLTSKCLAFLTSVVKNPNFFQFFNNQEIINQVLINILIPNIKFREFEFESFEDDELEFTKKDIENNIIVNNSDGSDTRKSAAIEFLKELKDKNETMVTNIVLKVINQLLLESSDWKNKDVAIYLFISIASKGNITASSGVLSTNPLVNVCEFFKTHISMDLLANESSHPILCANAMKFLIIFRYHLEKQQLIECFPLLLVHLTSNPHYFVYTYSAKTIETFLAMKDKSNATIGIFGKDDIKSVFDDLVNSIFGRITRASQSGKVVENEVVMKCLMRCLIVMGDELVVSNKFELIGQLMTQLIEIIQVIAKNPSNPKFSYYVFESIAIVIKYNSNNSISFIENFMELIVPNFLIILGEDVVEFVPYIIQIFAFLLELLSKANNESKRALPSHYTALIKPLLSPTLWEYKGNIPTITRLIIDILEYDNTSFDSNLIPLLGVFQKLISSKVHDSHGFDLLEAIFKYVDLELIKPLLNDIINLILARLQNARTIKFVKKFILLISTVSLLDNVFLPTSKFSKNVLGPIFAVEIIDQVQLHLFGNIFKAFFIPNIKEFNNIKEKKIVIFGLLNLISNNQKFQNGEYSVILPDALKEIYSSVTTFEEQVSLYSLNSSDKDTLISEFDKEEFTFGSSYSNLIIIGSNKPDYLSSVTIDQVKPRFLELVNKNQVLKNIADQLS